MYLYLSHVLSEDDPVYPGNLPLKIRPQFSHARGNLFDQSEFEMCNHIGTHIDLPRHFNPRGRTAEQMDPSEWVFQSPLLVDIPKGNGEMIEASDLQAFHAVSGDCDLLLIRTGFEQFRSQRERYARHNPALGRSLAEYVVSELPRLRAIGVDVISGANADRVPDAIWVHQTLLGCNSLENRYVLIIEDMSLQSCPRQLRQVIVLPLRIKGLDGVPCTIIGRC